MKKNFYSDFTEAQLATLAALDAKIAQATEDYFFYLDQYNWGMQYGSSSYAKKERWPRVVAAQQVLDALNEQKRAILASEADGQNLGLTDIIIDKSTEPEDNSLPWPTIGIAVGAVLLIVAVYKMF